MEKFVCKSFYENNNSNSGGAASTLTAKIAETKTVIPAVPTKKSSWKLWLLIATGIFLGNN